MNVSVLRFVLLGMGMTRISAFVVVRSTMMGGSIINPQGARTSPNPIATGRNPRTRPFVVWVTEVDAAELLTGDQVAARTAFYIWFFGASGAAGVARSAFPRMYHNIREIQSYRTLPGIITNGANMENEDSEMVGMSPLCGYPRDLAVQDVKAIVQNKVSIDQMVLQYPLEDNLWSQKGYITYQAFRQAHAHVDPLAVRAVFDCFSQSTEVSSPDIAQAKLDRYKESLDHFKQDLLYSKAVGWAAIATLLGLLGLADIEAFSYAYEGWFPDWPGGRLWLEGGLLDKDIGLLSIPEYWI